MATVARWFQLMGLAFGGLTGAGGGAVIQATPNPTGPIPSYLAAISCPSSSLCVSVGYDVTPNDVLAALSEVWNGSTWTIGSVDKPAGSSSYSLNGVSCPKTSSCFAVGQDTLSPGGPVPLAEHWNGSSWDVEKVPHPNAGTGGSELSGISCATASSCFAVGWYRKPHSGDELPLSERWNGSRWQIVTVPYPAKTVLRELYGVSCSSPSSCMAVGRANGATLGEYWNGSKWNTQLTNNPPGRGAPTLQSVSCLTESFCTAVGHHSDTVGITDTLVEHWNGHSWHLQQTNDSRGSENLYLEGISCISRTSCFAVGYFDEDGTLSEHWNGSAWTVMSTTARATGERLSGVSCAAASSCLAVGYEIAVNTGDELTLTEQLNGGSWPVVESPNAIGPQVSSLYSDYCVSSSMCVAVGNYRESQQGDLLTLAETWDGASWTLEPTENPGGTGPFDDNELSGVSCPSSSSCFAVGSYVSSAKSTALVEHWDGSAWSVQSNSAAGQLYGVDCPSTSSCFAVGISSNGALIGQWNGSSWNFQSIGKGSSAGTPVLSSVSCASPRSCVAVGSIAASWNGTSWAVEPYANPGDTANIDLVSVSCPSTTACLAVGTYTTSSSYVLVEHWNGKKWSLVSAPTKPAAVSLRSVSCRSTTSSCIVVGSYLSSRGLGYSLAQHWNGKTWTTELTPNPAGAFLSTLDGVSCYAASSCTAVGNSSYTGGFELTLAEHLG